MINRKKWGAVLLEIAAAVPMAVGAYEVYPANPAWALMAFGSAMAVASGSYLGLVVE